LKILNFKLLHKLQSCCLNYMTQTALMLRNHLRVALAR
jgi:hypothetical protein